ncbi:hypothetical protein SAMN04489712_11391 [Thermomonospora echinospora]|uniref:Uncharacterized protein n=1 Tax=Thermomonospora echinospora TaxID=1992 RepID=A0A1H6D5B9_9ACTN|nr:hypothetical protein [Thermomonospora echinospora]SEG80492.1 hypothetical protein SAMN04489712_11391 [Thermomonospora echinospora]
MSRVASVLTTVLGLVTAAGLLVVLRTGGFSGHTVAKVEHGSTALRQVPRPVTGRPLTVVTPEGDRYTVAAVRGATGQAPLSGLPAPPPGKGYAFIDYVLTNPHRRPVLLEFPPNVFLRRAVVPADFAERCVFRVGAPEDVCDLPGRTRVIARLRGSAGLLRQDADTYMAPGASYLVRTVADAPVPDSADRRDMGLYVWEVRFTQDRIARYVPFPG